MTRSNDQSKKKPDNDQISNLGDKTRQVYITSKKDDTLNKWDASYILNGEEINKMLKAH